MNKIGLDFPLEPRKTVLFDAEERYQHRLAEKLGRPWNPIKRSNFGQYDMAVNHLTTVLEEARFIENVAIFNIDHMAQVRYSGRDAASLLDRVLPANIAAMKIGQCKYTLLLNDKGCVLDDLIVMRFAEDDFVTVINAGHDLTGSSDEHGHPVTVTSDADFIASHKKEWEDVTIVDVSDHLVKVDIQGPYSYRILRNVFGENALKNRNDPAKPMGFFTFNEFELNGETYWLSRTGYTNRWGWEVYLPVSTAVEYFERIVYLAEDLGGGLVGLGGRDENRISAGPVGLPLMGQEYDREHLPTNCPLFGAAVDLEKADFVGREALLADRNNPKRMALFITEGLVVGRGIYKDGKRLGSVTSSINSPNVPLEKRLFLKSDRKNVNEPQGVAAIGIGWLYESPWEKDTNGADVMEKDGAGVRVPVEFYREDDGKPVGKPVIGYLSGDGITPATAGKPLKNIASL
jgi:aminomethyltransferase